MKDPTNQDGLQRPITDEHAMESTAMPSDLEAQREASCRLVLELLPEAVGGDLDERTEVAIARHVSSCHACGREWASLRRAHRALTSLAVVDVSDGEGADGGRIDEAFFAELHQDIIGEVQYRAQLEKDQSLFRAVRPLFQASGFQAPGFQAPGLEAPRRDSMTAVGVRGLWSRFRAPILHVSSLAAAVLLGILVGKQFEAGTGNPESNPSDPGTIMVHGESEEGALRGAGGKVGPRVKRIDERDPDAEFRASLNRWLKDFHLPQPVVPSPVIPEGTTRGLKEGSLEKAIKSKRGQDF